MKGKYPIIYFILISPFFFGCKQTRSITENYIKTEIQPHKSGELGTIKTYSIYNKISKDRSSYLEFTGYKMNGTKGLVIGADKYYSIRPKFEGEQAKLSVITYIVLTEIECNLIMQNYILMLSLSNEDRPIKNEEIYQDYTVNKDLFISVHKRFMEGDEEGGLMDPDLVYFWIQGEKYSISSTQLFSKLKLFLKY